MTMLTVKYVFVKVSHPDTRVLYIISTVSFVPLSL